MRFRSCKNCAMLLATAIGCGVNVRHSLAESAATASVEVTNAISREVSVFRPGATLTITDVISREVSVFKAFPIPEINDAISREVSAFSVIPLTLGTPHDGMLSVGSFLYFRVTTPPGETVRVTLHHDSPTASTELLANFGATPDSLSAQFAGESIGTDTRELVIPTTQAGTYFILARTNSDTNPNASKTFDLVATTALFGIDRVTPSTVGAGVATLTIKGARFDDSTTFAVRDPQTGFVLNPTAVTLIDAATARVTFDFSTLGQHAHDVVAERPGGPSSSLPVALRIETPTAQNRIELTHNVPRALRGGRAFDGTFSIKNLGNVDIPVVLLLLLAPNDDAVELGLPDIPGTDIENFGENKGFLLLFSNVGPGQTRTVAASILAQQPFPAHGLLSVRAQATPYSLGEFRDGPLYAMSEQFRHTLMNTPNLPAAVLDVASDPQEWWDRVREYFDATGLTPFVNQQRVAGHVVEHVVTAMSCGLFCLYFCDFVAIAFPPGAWALPLCIASCEGACTLCVLYPAECVVLIICVTAILEPTVAGEVLCILAEILYAWDPNEKDGPAGFAGPKYLADDIALEYRVLFENVATATAPAAEIRITDELDASLDPTTVRFTRVKFGDAQLDVPPDRNAIQTVADIRDPQGEQDLQVLVEIMCGVDLPNRRVWCNLTALDPATRQLPADPTLGFLPPNVNAPEGEGFVEFTIKPLPDTPTGTVIRNKASITFDYNDPIITNEVFNTIDAGAPTSAVGSLPAQIASPFVVRWAAQDDVGGSGLAVVDVFVKTDEGPFVPWLSNASDWAYFSGEVGKTYSFYALGRDFVSNVENAPAIPDAVTVVTSLRRPGDVDFDGDVDLVDHQSFAQCFRVNGPDSIGGPDAQVTSACAEADLNIDRRVDLADFAILQNGFMLP
ncbi:MAG: hypothetical protein AABZ47_10045 [Planctomycetota bacterium]